MKRETAVPRETQRERERARMGVGEVAIVRHCYGDGLWQLEGPGGVMYLAVKANPWRPAEHAHWTADEDLPPVPLPTRRDFQLRPI